MSVVVVSTGGTIAMRPDPGTGELVPAVSGGELLETIGWPDAPPIELDDFSNVPSFDMHGDLCLALARRVREHVGRGHGVVVAHGTDTMEETVYFVDRLLGLSTPPVVLTGAQRGASEADTDGPRNLRDAIRAAGSAPLLGCGAVVCFGGELHAAREVRKVHTSDLRAFASPGYGPIGHVDGARVVLHRRPIRRPPLSDPSQPLPRVELIRVYAGADAALLRAAAAAGAKAIVLEGTGRGNANAAVVEGVREVIASGVPVAVATRCVAGRVEPLYGRGGGSDLADAGALFAGDLAGPKVRVLLQLALSAGVPVAEALSAEAG